MSKEHFEQKKLLLDSIPDDLVNYPSIPVDIALQEAEDLWMWCQADKELLVKTGLDWNLVDDLPARIGSCRYLQSKWQKEYLGQKKVQKDWANKSPKAYRLRNELLHHFLFAFHNLPDLHARSQRIAKGRGHADMIQDLSDLAALGKANKEPLIAAGVDTGLLDLAEISASEMAVLLSKVNAKKLGDNKMRLLRDKAFLHMKEAVDEIRRCGKYLFWKDAQRRKGYLSRYIKSKRKGKPRGTDNREVSTMKNQ